MELIDSTNFSATYALGSIKVVYWPHDKFIDIVNTATMKSWGIAPPTSSPYFTKATMPVCDGWAIHSRDSDDDPSCSIGAEILTKIVRTMTEKKV